ncbi:hypothetical protein J1605_012807 [Eschrichtius robustus]|uniref:Protein SirB1 N-terminal domain-containing protein n=1 Tax=Eschrichtius robustus TaxID=9764 RepID=A0AB34GKQ5_ESCRO|nr:hypothetical protein J1605_012807 [Eschrichtius robustus]
MSNVDCEGQGSKQEAAMIQTKEDGGLDELDVFTFLICFDDRTKSIGGGLNMAVRESKESRMAPEGVASLDGAVYIDQYCNPLSDISLRDIQAQIDSIVELVCKTLRGINSRHPSLAFKAGESSMIMEIELQSQVLDAMNYVLYDQLKFKGNRMDYYNALNLYMHQVLIRRTGIPISMSLLYLTIARQLGVPLEPVNFPSHFLLRWCQGAEGATLDIFDYIYIDAFGKGKQLTVKECEYLIGQHVTAALYGVVNVKKVLQRMVGNLLSLGKREGIDQSYQLLRDSLDLYLAMYPDQVQLLLLQARLYFHLGIWPEKVIILL